MILILIGAANFRILRFGVVQHFAVSMTFACFCYWVAIPVEQCDLQERVHDLALEYAHQAFVWHLWRWESIKKLMKNLHSSKILAPQKWTDCVTLYVLFLFDKVSTYLSDVFDLLQRFSLWALPGWEAHQISTEKEALLRSLALLRERQKAPVAGTATRVGTTFWPIARWVLRVCWLPVPHAELLWIFHWAEFMPLQWIRALGVQQERHYFEESNTKMFDWLENVLSFVTFFCRILSFRQWTEALPMQSTRWKRHEKAKMSQ